MPLLDDIADKLLELKEKQEAFKKAFGKTYNKHYLDLRHSCASLLLAKGIPMKFIQEWLGHSNFSTTANLYAHLDSNSKKKSAEVLYNALKFTDTKKENEESESSSYTNN